MSVETPSVFHIDTEKGWGGGQNQVFLLIQELILRDYKNFLIAPQGEDLWNALLPLMVSNSEKLTLIPVYQRNQLDLSGLYRVLKNLKKQEHPILHLHSWRGDLLGGLASLLSTTPLVITRRINYPLSRATAFFINRLKKATVVAISESVKESLEESGVAKDIDVIRDGIDVESFAVEELRKSEKDSSKEKQFLIGHIGSFNKIKGQKHLIEILSDLASRHVPVHVLFAGEGRELSSVKRLAEKRGLLPRVTFLGKVSPITDFLSSIDMLAVTSVVEGLGVSAMEAMAAGLPIVSFKTGGLPEIIQDGVTGYIVLPGDSSAFSQAVKKLIEDKDLRKRMGSEGRKRARTHFSHRVMVDSYEKLYKKTLTLL